MKFQDDYSTIIATFEDFILLVYAIIDDLYQQFVPSSVSQRRNITSAKMSDSEIITYSFFTNRQRIAFSTARIITPTSAKIARYIFAIPTAPNARQANFTTSAIVIF